MARAARNAGKSSAAKMQAVNLSKHFNWPRRVPKAEFWQKLAKQVYTYPSGSQQSWGIPFALGQGKTDRVLMVANGVAEIAIPLKSTARYLCFLHTWEQIPETVNREKQCEGMVVGEYELTYDDGTSHVQPVRGRFEVPMAESPGMPWLALPSNMWEPIDPMKPPADMTWGVAQYGYHMGHLAPWGPLRVYAMGNPHPEQKIARLTIRGLQESPLIIGGLTLYRGSSHPLRHLPRRTYRVGSGRGVRGKAPVVENAEVDLGIITRIEKTSGPRSKEWLAYPLAGTPAKEPGRGGENLIEMSAAEDATLSVKLEGIRKPVEFCVGEAFHAGKTGSGTAWLEVLGKDRQWMTVRVIDASTGKPTPARVHFSGPRGEYLAPYGHHSQINTNWFEDYGADVVVGGTSCAYVPGEFATDLPVGDVFVQLYKGFEYEPLRTKVAILPGQKLLELKVSRWKDLRSRGWVTADTHVHFISPHTAWLEAQAEGVNVVNLLASQWGRLFTNVGDCTGRVGVAEDDTIVYVGTENRNHMLGHMSMLGTKGLPVYPMCCGGVSESWIGDPDLLTMAEWAAENRRRGGLVIRPHFPYCGYTEDPVPIVKGLVDAVECGDDSFSRQEWYRYLNCGYRVAVVGGTDKMGAYVPIGCLRTYAKLDPNEPFTYDAWADAVRAGRTISTTGPLMDLTVEGRTIGDTIRLPAGGGTLGIDATAECAWPIGRLEVIVNGRVAARAESTKGARKLHVNDRVAVNGSGWIAARCTVATPAAGFTTAAHTSPVYIKCGDTCAFDGPAVQHMLALIEGGIEYLSTIATVFDEASKQRMIGVYREVQDELQTRLRTEGR